MASTDPIEQNSASTVIRYAPGKNPNSRNGFKKGHVQYSTGLADSGYCKKGNVPWNKGRKERPEVTAKRTGLKRTPEFSAYLGRLHKGRKLSEEAKMKISAAHQGVPLSEWNGRISSTNELARKSVEYKLWRTAVFERDEYTCRNCGAKNRKGNGKTIVLHADHIKPFALYFELRFAIDNGRTLCVPCHKKTDTYGFKIKTYHV